MTTIAVTGASGKLGRATIQFLLNRGVAPASIVAIVRDPAKVSDLTARGVQARRGDYTALDTLQSAFRGIDKLCFISTSALGDERMRQHRNVVDAAKSAGVGHIIYTSVIKPAAEANFAASPGHFHTEALITQSGIPWTFFRNNLYLDILPMMVGKALESGQIVQAAGEGRVGFVLREDIAEALAQVLTTSGHEKRAYPITTSLACYSFADIAQALSKASGKTVSYVNTPRDELKAGMEAAGVPEGVIAMTLALGNAIRAGEFDLADPQLELLLGRSPVTLGAFAERTYSRK